MKILDEKDGFFQIKIMGEEVAVLAFNPITKELNFKTENNLSDLLRANEYQLRKLLHNKRPETYYKGFELKFSIIDGKDVEKFNDRQNILVVDHGEISVKAENEKKNVIEVYTDGSFNDKRNLGAYTILIKALDGCYEEKSFLSKSKSSSLIELEAVIRAMEITDEDIRIITDSQYVRKGITEWIVHWKENEWMTANGTKAKNIEVWKYFDKLCQNRYIELEWVKAHSNHFENDWCDIKSREMTKKI